MEDLQSYLNRALKEVEFSDTVIEEKETNDNIQQELSELIVATRTELGMTQKELSERTGISQANISKIENKIYLPSIHILNRIANGFNKQLVFNFIDSEEEY